MKRLIFILILIPALIWQVQAQTKVAASPGRLMVSGKTIQGDDFTAESTRLEMTSVGNVLHGKIDPKTITSQDPEINDIISRIEVEEIRFEFVIPQDLFQFSSNINKQIRLEGDIYSGDYREKFFMDFTVSNRIIDKNNRFFLIIGSGRLSVTEDFGLTDQGLVQDELVYSYSINMEVHTR